MMRSNEYWTKRAEKRTAKYEKKSHASAIAVSRVYATVKSYLTDECNRVFSNFAVGIPEAEARRLINKTNTADVIAQVKSMLDATTDPQLQAALRKQIVAPAYRARLMRLEQLMSQVDAMTYAAGRKELAIARKAYVDVTNTAYNTTMQDLQVGMGQISEFATLPKKRIDEILSTNWSGRHYSRRIWDNTGELAEVLKNELTVGFACGKSSAKMSRIIADRFHTTQSNAARLIRTESNYVANQAELESYKVMGINQYRFLATLDKRTSELCQSQDGKIYSVEDAKAGENLPPLHPYCRSTTIPVVDDAPTDQRFARGVDGKGYQVDGNMTYDEWKSLVVKEQGQDKVGLSEKKLKNSESDRGMYEEYKLVLGKFTLKSFANFQNMKYNGDIESWVKMKRNYKLFSKIDNTPTYSPEYKHKLKETYLYFKDEGFEFTEHALGRVIGQKSGKGKRSFENADALMVLRQPPNFMQEDGKLVRFYNDLAIIQASDTNEIVSIVVKNKARSDWKEI